MGYYICVALALTKEANVEFKKAMMDMPLEKISELTNGVETVVDKETQAVLTVWPSRSRNTWYTDLLTLVEKTFNRKPTLYRLVAVGEDEKVTHKGKFMCDPNVPWSDGPPFYLSTRRAVFYVDTTNHDDNVHRFP